MKSWMTSPRRRGPLALVVLALLLAVAGACDPGTTAPMAPAVDTYVTSANPRSAPATDGFIYVRSDTKTHVGYLRYRTKNVSDGTYRATLRITTMEDGKNVWVHNADTIRSTTTYNSRPALRAKVGFLGWTQASHAHTLELTGVVVKDGYVNLGLATSSPGQLRILSTEGARWVQDMTAAPLVALHGTTSAPPTTATPTTATPTTATPTTATPTTATPTTATPSTATPTTTPTSSTPGGIYVDQSRIPAPEAGRAGQLIVRASYSKHAGDGSASWRTNCRPSHYNFDDPIVFPGRTRATHLHTFWGNTQVDGNSTASSILNQGRSTCMGGELNRTAYWAPTMIDTRNGTPVSFGSDTDKWDALQVYYKTGYRGVTPSMVRNFPAGLRMIAGTSSSTTPQNQNIVWYSCHLSGGAHTSSIPNCPAGDIMVMTVEFPQCWDGRNLDSPDHKSHMAYGAGWPDRGCPSSHPVALPQVTMNMRYRVPAGGTGTWRLSSDMYSGPAGYSGHADWFNGWHAPTFQRIVDNCYRGGYDCSMNLLGDGYMLG